MILVCISLLYLINKLLYIPPLAPRDLLDLPEREVRYFSRTIRWMFPCALYFI